MSGSLRHGMRQKLPCPIKCRLATALATCCDTHQKCQPNMYWPRFHASCDLSHLCAGYGPHCCCCPAVPFRIISSLSHKAATQARVPSHTAAHSPAHAGGRAPPRTSGPPARCPLPPPCKAQGARAECKHGFTPHIYLSWVLTNSSPSHLHSRWRRASIIRAASGHPSMCQPQRMLAAMLSPDYLTTCLPAAVKCDQM
jgi:hypothetical protein